MKVSPELLEFLACPKCEDRPGLKETEHGLKCEKCQTTFELIPAAESKNVKVIPSLM